MRRAISPYKNCCASKGARRLNCWMTWLLLMGRDLGSDMKIKNYGIKKLIKHLRHYRQNPVQWARFKNHQRGFHCNQGWHSVHVNPRMSIHQWMLQKPTQGLRKLAEWLNTVCVLCRLGSDSGSVCSACRQAMRTAGAAVPRCWRCQQRLAATPARSEEHTSELQSRGHLVCRLLLENKKLC